MGEPTNENPDCFWQADVEEAAQRLAGTLRDVDADVLTIYDPHGLYGHPDHIQVHRVGLRAAAIAGVDHVYEATVSREDALASMEEHGLDENAVDRLMTESTLYMGQAFREYAQRLIRDIGP